MKKEKTYNIYQIRQAWGAGVHSNANKTNNPHALAGKFFVTWHDRDKQELKFQGKIIEALSNNCFLIEFYSWIDGCKTNEKIISLKEMIGWILFDNHTSFHYFLWTNMKFHDPHGDSWSHYCRYANVKMD